MGGGAWSNDQPREFLFPPGGSLSLPHILIGPDIPAVLTNFSADYTWQFAMLWYYDATNFAFQALAINTRFGIDEWITGTYDTVSGVQFKQIISGTGDAFPNSLYYGSDFYATANKLLVEWRNANLVVDLLSTLNSENGVLQNGTAEPWHAVTFSAAGWTNQGGAAMPTQYKIVPSPSNFVRLVGVMTPSATKADGTVIFTMPGIYVPTHTQDIPVAVNTMAGAAAQSPHLSIATNGQVSCWGCASATIVSVNWGYQID